MDKTTIAIEAALESAPDAMHRNVFSIHHEDCRNIDRLVNGQVVDVTVTSPPYFDLKDYGSNQQIGFGQSYDDYLRDLADVFRKIYAVTKDTGSLWIIINTFRLKHELVPLPFDLARALAPIGWSLQDVVIWKKERTVPWVAKGKTRSIFEYVLFFSKSKATFKYYADRVRQHDSLKGWWVRYPERYNPHGKLPEEIWEYDIPVQGAWGNGDVRHFCPLPQGLIDRILELATDPLDVVLDPFAGSGTVLARAQARGRRWLGFETNDDYVARIRSTMNANSEGLSPGELKSEADSKRFFNLIVQLRALKFARLLTRQLRSQHISTLDGILVEPLDREPKLGKLMAVRYLLRCDGSKAQKEKLLAACHRLASRPPLSKFGLDFQIRIVSVDYWQRRLSRHVKLFGYTASNTHSYFCSQSERKKLLAAAIVSPFAVDVNKTLFVEY